MVMAPVCCAILCVLMVLPAPGGDSMATATEKKPNKTTFITEYLRKNPTANAKAVNEAWTKAGQKGTISTTLVQKVRKEEGLTGNLRPRAKSARSDGAAKATQSKTKKRELKWISQE